MNSTDPAAALLPSPPGVVRRAVAAHPLLVDIFIVVWYLIGAGGGMLLDLFDATTVRDLEREQGLITDGVSYLAWPFVLLAIARVLIIATALLLRRRFPLQGLIAVVLVGFGPHGISSVATTVAVLFLLYAVPVYRSVALGWIGYGITVVASVLGAFAAAQLGFVHTGAVFMANDDPLSLGEAVRGQSFVILWNLAAVLVGINLGNRRRYVASIIDRAHELARERDQRAKLAVAEERARISREMHDIVAHSLSVMIALSEGAARAVRAAPDSAVEALERSAETGRTALAEMRRQLGALRDDDELAFAPQPSLADIGELVQGFREAGLDASLEQHGEPSGDLGQELAAYRIVQEGLTNALRYAGDGAKVLVSVSGDPRETRVTVRDYGPAYGRTAPPPTGIGSGRGLAGLTERVRMFGGTIETGPARDGVGWHVEATIPVDTQAQSMKPKENRD